ncbi:MAG: efflux RND transporter periplasmic adaptor subunit [Candidatus Moranbacteria bacterium]|nr:efflux RND transporter periplasmic adaptor subunit [Candidatus Moranbacteria bacterium]
MSTKKKVISALVVFTLIGGGYYYFKMRDTTVSVQTETVRRGDVSETVSVTGELIPEEYADVAFLSAGTVDGVYVQTGDTVEKGARIASIDRTVLYSQLKDARITARIAEQSEQLILRKRLSPAPEEREAKKLASEQARERVRTLELQMRENVLVSPMSGSISKFDARVGEVVTLGQTIARVIKPGAYVLESRVPESDIAKITLGMRARITFDSLSSDDIFEGEVLQIDPAATVVQDVVSYKVQFRLARSDERLKEGMTGNIDIETANRSNVLWVPFRALTKENTKTFAEVKQADQSFQKVEVTTGLEGDDGTIEVKTGLKEGDEVTIGATQAK